MEEKLSFASDYTRTAHPKVMEALASTMGKDFPGYGDDPLCKRAADKIRLDSGCPDAEVKFLEGGTQTNALAIGMMLSPSEGVIAPSSGHIGVHEAGAIEALGHKVLSLPSHEGKLDADEVKSYLETFHADANREHMVLPAMVYVTQPTEYGTLYSKDELLALRGVCDSFGIPLYMDGARLCYALASEKDLTLKDYASACDAFYIGGTKCGAMMGEALVFPRIKIRRLTSMIKQSGGLLAKGWILGAQFDALFTDSLYLECGKRGVETAMALKEVMKRKGYRMLLDSPTNQQFFILDNATMEDLGKKVNFEFWEKCDESHTVVRFTTSWATDMDDIRRLEGVL